MVPASRSRVIERVVITSVDIIRIVPISPGTIFKRGDLFRVVARVHHDVERRLHRRGLHVGRQVARQHVGVQRGHRRGGVADRHRIGGVGVQQHRRMVAAIHRAREVGRDFQHEQHVAVGQRLVRLLLRGEGADVEIAGVLQRRRSACVRRCEWSADSTPVGRSCGLVLMAKPNRKSCISGSMTISPMVIGSRRICSHSLRSMAMKRAKEKAGHGECRASRPGLRPT